MTSKGRSYSWLALLLTVAASTSGAWAQTDRMDASGVAYDVIERGEDFDLYRRVTTVTDESGATTVTTNQFSLLENCLNYFEDGQWKSSEDLIEAAPDGAVARRGPNKAIFSPDLNSPAVFDILGSDGQRLRGGVRAPSSSPISPPARA